VLLHHSTRSLTRPSPFSSVLLASNERKEHVEGNLDSIDEDEAVLVGDELEVDSMDNWPDLPGALDGGEEVGLDLLADGSKGVTVNQTKISEEDSHEDGAPKDLIDADLQSNVLSLGSLNLVVKPVVEVVSGGAMVNETKDRKSDEALHVEGSSTNENLQKHNVG